MDIKKALIALSTAAVLASCQSSPERRAQIEAEDRAWCTANGSPDGPALTSCMMGRSDQRQADRNERTQRFLAASQALNAQLAQQQQLYNQNRPRTTNCYRVGNMVQCRTM